MLPGGALLAGTDGAGVRRSDDQGRTWASANDGFAERFVSQILFDGPRLVAGLLGDRLHSGVMVAPRFDGPWTRRGARPRRARAVQRWRWCRAADGPPEVLAGTDHGLYLSVSRSRRVALAAAGGDGIDESGRVAAAVAAVGRAPCFLAGTERGLLRSADGGRPGRARAGPRRPVTALAVSPRDRAVVLAATRLDIYRSARRRRHLGARGGAGPLDVQMGSLQFLPDGQDVLVGTSARGLVLVRQDQGRTWMRAAAACRCPT